MSEPSQNTSNSSENQPKQDQAQSQSTPADVSASPTTAMNPAVTPAMDSPMSPEEQEAAQAANEVDALTVAQAELATLKAKSADLADQFLRAKAEAENARRRAEDEISKARKFAVESFAESLLPVADSLEAGLAIKDASVEQIREGSEATLRQLSAALERNKVIAINPEAGAKFDPHFHQAISVVPSELEANTVVMVLQKGYSIADRVMRPALVTVSAPK
jgi:molecular chaperone GrpE